MKVEVEQAQEERSWLKIVTWTLDTTKGLKDLFNKHGGCQHHQQSIGSGFPLPDSAGAITGHVVKIQYLTWGTQLTFSPVIYMTDHNERAQWD